LKVAKEEQDIGFYAGFVGEQCFFVMIGVSRLGFVEMFYKYSSPKVTCHMCIFIV
jgi:hypothetical protein